MGIARIYVDATLDRVAELILSPEASHHLITVLRCKIGEKLFLFNGDGSEHLAEVVSLSNKNVTLRTLKKQFPQRESTLKVELAQGISRGERMDYVIQKAVELGVDVITPLFTERCNVKLKAERLQRRLQHWQKVIIAACEQSGRLKVPRLNTPQKLACWLALPKSGGRFVCTPADQTTGSFSTSYEQLALLIGPEGGLTSQEIEAAKQEGFSCMQLGPRTLRTETATVVALSAVQLRWGDLSTDR